MKFIQLFIPAFILFLGISFFDPTYSQTIFFCEDVDTDGYPINESSVFTIPEEGGNLYVLVEMPFAIECHYVDLFIYHNGNYDNTIQLETELDWESFWKDITFYKPGEYVIEIYDCFDDVLVKGKVKIIN